jgi:hypothetical protein
MLVLHASVKYLYWLRLFRIDNSVWDVNCIFRQFLGILTIDSVSSRATQVVLLQRGSQNVVVLNMVRLQLYGDLVFMTNRHLGYGAPMFGFKRVTMRYD